ncbi:MAG: hypothetical protein MZU97_22520 [Bacillus subtilis]|nr:hypothetical protein [Bacillus subtilis]
MNPMKLRLLLAIAQLSAVVLIVIGVTLAWFTVATETNVGLVGQTGSIATEYDFYVFQEPNFRGATNQTVSTDLCDSPNAVDCYKLIENPTAVHMIEGTRTLMPGDRFSFAIRIANQGTTDGVLSLTFTSVLSTGFLLDANRIQRAFTYLVTKIVYVDENGESEDIKDGPEIDYAGKGLPSAPFFSVSPSATYLLASGIALEDEGPTAEIIIYFELYFDPSIEGVDALGAPTGNSNAFMNQDFLIEHILMAFD